MEQIKPPEKEAESSSASSDKIPEEKTTAAKPEIKDEIPQKPAPQTNGRTYGQRNRPEITGRIVEMIRMAPSPGILRESLETCYAYDVAEALESLTSEERDRFFKVLDAADLALVLACVDEDRQIVYLSEMNIRKVIPILEEMEPDQAADILRQMSSARREIILELMEPVSRRNVSLIISYGDDQIGSRMTTDYIEIPMKASIKEATQMLARQARNSEHISRLYVVDESGTYSGVIRLIDLFAADDAEGLQEVIEVNYPYVYATEPLSDALEHLREYSEDSIPVVNQENQMLGIITSTDLLEVLDKDRLQDYARFAGLSHEEDLNAPVFQSLQKRVPRLLGLLILCFVISMIVDQFSWLIACLPVVFFLQSLVLDMAGNAGSQSLSVSLRVLSDPSLKDVELNALVIKEVKTGMLNGLACGLAAVVLIGLWIDLAGFLPAVPAWKTAFCAGFCIFLNMSLAAFCGSALPAWYRKHGKDPNQISGSFITTLNDLVGVVTYYGFCWLVLVRWLQF